MSQCGSLKKEAWEALRKAVMYHRGKPIGTIAATTLDPLEDALNYNQVFMRDFFSSGIAFLIAGEPEMVKNFLLMAVQLQGNEKQVDCFTLGEGVMPASFKVTVDLKTKQETVEADFGEAAIARVAPVDSGFWWIVLLRAYTYSTGDHSVADSPQCQLGIIRCLNLCLKDGFDTFPTLLCADGCSMIDRRMGIYGYPLDIQSLFYMALRCGKELLRREGDVVEFVDRIDKRLHALTFHMRQYFWLDHKQLNNIYRYKTEEYSFTAVNKFNIMPDSLPDWVFDFLPNKGGYLVGNVSPAFMDFRWFTIGNFLAITSSLATPQQSQAIMDLVEARWDELIGDMPVKCAYPALEGEEWRIITGCDPKNTRWSYHNGGSWPVFLWFLTAASIKAGRPAIARRAVELAERRLYQDDWPEYYDGKLGRTVGKQARKLQTWSISGYLVSKLLMEDPTQVNMLCMDEDKRCRVNPLARSSSYGGGSCDSGCRPTMQPGHRQSIHSPHLVPCPIQISGIKINLVGSIRATSDYGQRSRGRWFLPMRLQEIKNLASQLFTQETKFQRLSSFKCLHGNTLSSKVTASQRAVWVQQIWRTKL